MITTSTHVAGLGILDQPCPKCGRPLFEKPCPCHMRRRGWAKCAKCLNPKCAITIGLEKKKRG